MKTRPSRKALIMMSAHGRSDAQIAARYGVQPATVRQWKTRAAATVFDREAFIPLRTAARMLNASRWTLSSAIREGHLECVRHGVWRGFTPAQLEAARVRYGRAE